MKEYPERTRKLRLNELNVINDDDDHLYLAMNKEEMKKCRACGQKYSLAKTRTHMRALTDILADRKNYIITDAENYQLIKLIHQHGHFFCQDDECKAKNKMQETPITFAEKGSRFTCRMEWAIFNSLLAYPATKIAELMNGRLRSDGEIPKKPSISKTTLQKVFLRITSKLDELIPPVRTTPQSMGFHTIEAGKRSYLYAMDFSHFALIDVLEGAESLTEFSKKYNKDEIDTIWIDVNPALLDSVRAAFPKSTICVGRPQLIHRINKAIKQEVKESAIKPRTIYKIVTKESIPCHKELRESKKKARMRKRALDRFPALSLLAKQISAIEMANSDDLLSGIDKLRKESTVTTHAIRELYEDIDYFRRTSKKTASETDAVYGDDSETDVVFGDDKDFFPEEFCEDIQNVKNAVDGAMEITKVRSFEVVRARILYGTAAYDLFLDIPAEQKEDFSAFEKEYRSAAGNLEDTYSEELAFGETLRLNLIFHLYTVHYDEEIGFFTYGQPLRQVASRMQEFNMSVKNEKHHPTQD